MAALKLPIDEVVHFTVTTRDPATGGESDATGDVVFNIYEEATDTPIAGSPITMTKRTSLTGRYRGTFTMSAANGFEAGKFYDVIVTGTVVGITDNAPVMLIHCVPAESVVGVPKVDVTHYAGSPSDVSTMPASIAAALADTNELQTDWANGGRLDLIIDATLADTNELQTDWVNGGRLDLILDATATASALASLVTTVGVAGAGLTAADDAVIAAIAALNNITAASVWAVGTRVLTAGTNIDGSTFNAIPWNASWDAEVQSEVADALTAFGVSTVTTAQVNTEVDAALSDVGLTTTITGRIDAAVSTRATPAQVNTEVLDVLNVDTLIDGKTFVQAVQYIGAITAGRISGAGTGTETFKGLDESTTRVTITVDASGNRSDVTYG